MFALAVCALCGFILWGALSAVEVGSLADAHERWMLAATIVAWTLALIASRVVWQFWAALPQALVALRAQTEPPNAQR
jgi:hypothetical protein